MDASDELFSEKLALMCLYYPGYLKDALGDLLRGCRGDVDATRLVIDGPQRVKRRGLHQSNLGRNIRVKRVDNGSGAVADELKAGEVAGVAKAVAGEVAGIAVAGVLTMPQLDSTVSPRKTVVQNNKEDSIKRLKGHVVTLNTPRDVQMHLGKYASLHPNFFSTEIADMLLDDLLENTDYYTTKDFYLFGNHCVLNHGNGGFCKPGSVYPDLIYNGRKTRKPRPYSAIFNKAADTVDAYVNDVVIPANDTLPFQRKQPWCGNFCVVNYYQKLHNNLEWHSDRLSHIGPHNYIASVSLGSTRMFRLRSNESTNGTIYQIPLTHNSLLIMKPGCQEKYKHCVNSMLKALEVHPKVGTTRFGLTFRCYDPTFLANLPKCKCDMSMTLRRSFKTKATRGRYFWLCENLYQNKDCGTFHWADFSNAKGHYIAKDTESISTWVE